MFGVDGLTSRAQSTWWRKSMVKLSPEVALPICTKTQWVHVYVPVLSISAVKDKIWRRQLPDHYCLWWHVRKIFRVSLWVLVSKTYSWQLDWSALQTVYLHNTHVTTQCVYSQTVKSHWLFTAQLSVVNCNAFWSSVNPWNILGDKVRLAVQLKS